MRRARGRAMCVVALVALLPPACGGGGPSGDPLALKGAPSDACSQAIMQGHNNEAAGKPAPFLPSVQACGSLDAWIAAANAFGINLNGREAQYVDNTCNTAGPDVRALKICEEAKAAANDPRRIP